MHDSDFVCVHCNTVTLSQQYLMYCWFSRDQMAFRFFIYLSLCLSLLGLFVSYVVPNHRTRTRIYIRRESRKMRNVIGEHKPNGSPKDEADDQCSVL